jgi:hypothetical protein
MTRREALEETLPANTVTLDFQPPEIWQPPVYGALLQQPEEMNHQGQVTGLGWEATGQNFRCEKFTDWVRAPQLLFLCLYDSLLIPSC